MEEREINLIDLIIDILLHWRGILIFMLIGGIAMGGFSYMRSGQSIRSRQNSGLGMIWESEEAHREHLEGLLTETEKTSVYSVVQNEKQYENLVDYMNNSALMQIDPQHVQRAELVFGVIPEGTEALSANVYIESLANEVGLYEWLEEQTGIDSSVVSELVSVGRKTEMEILGEEDSELFVWGKDVLKITVNHFDQEKCKELAQSVIDYVDGQQNKLAQTMGKCKVELLNQSFSVVTDMKLMEQQIDYNKDAISLSSYAKEKEAFTETQNELYQLLRYGGQTADEEEETAEPGKVSAESVSPSVSMKYVLLGMFLAAFIYAFILFCRYIFNGRLRATDNLGELYGIPQIGLIPGHQKKKKVFGFVDEWILALRNRNKRKFGAEEAMELAATAVRISAGKNMLDTVYLMGCDLKEGAMELCQQIKTKLEQENIHVHVLNNVLYNAEILGQLEAAKGVVLVERAGSTLYTEIVKELELLKRQEIQVLGGIVVE